MNIYINGTQVYAPNGKVNIKRTLDKSLDSSLFTIYNTTVKYAYEPETLVQIDDDYYILDSDKSISSNLKEGLYTHNISLLEYTHKLEGYLLPNLTAYSDVDGTSKTLDELVTRLIKICNRYNGTSLVLDSTASTTLAKYTAFDYQLTEPTMREALDNIVESKNYLIRLKRVSGVDTICIDEKNPIGSLFDKGYYYEECEWNSKDYATTLQSNMSNAISLNSTGGINTVDKIRLSRLSTYTDTRITSANASMVTQKPIAISGTCIIYFKNKVGTEAVARAELDITDRIYDKREWDTLDIAYSSSTVNKQNTLYYEYLGHEIKNIYDDEGIFSSPVLENILDEELIGTKTFWEYNELLFDLEYKTNDDLMLRAETVKLDNFNNRKTVFYNQNDNQVDINKYGQNLYNVANGYGNQIWRVQGSCVLESDLPEIGDYKDDFILTILEYNSVIDIGGNTYFKWIATFYQNYTSINPRIAVDSVKRIYNIPLEGIKRSQVFKHYISFYETKPTVSNITTSGLGSIISTFIQGSSLGGLGIGVAAVRTTYEDATTSQLLALDANTAVSGRSILVSMEFKDNYSAGKRINGTVVGGLGTKEETYCDENGEFEDIAITLYNNFSTVDTTDSTEMFAQLTQAEFYPRVYSTDLPTSSLYSITLSDFLKDRGETPRINLQFEFINTDYIKIGQQFIDINGLIKNLTHTNTGKYIIGCTELQTDNNVEPLGIDTIYSATTTYFNYDLINYYIEITPPATGWDDYESFVVAEYVNGQYVMLLGLNQNGGELKKVYAGSSETRP